MSQGNGPGRERETEAERAHRFNKKKYTSRVFTNVNKYVMEDKFRVIRCRRCLSCVIITDAELDKLPRRRTDNAPVLCPDQWTIRTNTRPVDQPHRLKRLRGLETQYYHACAECGQHVMYQSVPHNSPLGGPPNPKKRPNTGTQGAPNTTQGAPSAAPGAANTTQG
ncbi:hypothetical protein, conserved, partial [Eimeria tenella]